MDLFLWPENQKYAKRFWVEDLVPEVPIGQIRCVFVGESPHTEEVEPPLQNLRSPFRGKAGRNLFEKICRKPIEGSIDREIWQKKINCSRVAILNAVQFPLDEKITKPFPDASPSSNLKFAKVTGEASFRKVFIRNPDRLNPAFESLKERLNPYIVARIPVIALGGDAEWFIRAVWGEDFVNNKDLFSKCPHPVTWKWFPKQGAIAETVLDQILT